MLKQFGSGKYRSIVLSDSVFPGRDTKAFLDWRRLGSTLSRISRCKWTYVGRGAAISLALILTPSQAFAQSGAYWLSRGKHVVKCPGVSAPEPFKLANATDQWGDIYGVLRCSDEGSNYRFEIEYIKFQVNPARREAINRQQLKFDWIGLAIYRPDGSGQGVSWLYDEAKPIQGMLNKSDAKPIIFGNLAFVVPKLVLDRAENFVFYVTTQGVLHTFFWLV